MKNIIILSVDATKYSLEESKAEQIKNTFIPIVEEVQKFDTEYNEILDAPISPDLIPKAKELRLKLVKKRTATKNLHKQEKDYYLNGGRYVDGIKNLITEGIETAEAHLDAIENHYVNIEKARVDQLHTERLESLKPFEYIESGLSFGSMPEADWNHYFTGVKTSFENKKAEELALKEKEEQDRLDRIKLEQDNAKLKEQLQVAEKKVEVIEKKIETIAKVNKTIPELIEKIETYGFTCEAGNLTMCKDWQELKKVII